MDKRIKNMSDTEIVFLMNNSSLLDTARKKFAEHREKITQAIQGTEKPLLTPIMLRRMEFDAVIEIAKALKMTSSIFN
jgi:hypothetical protein